MAQAFEIPLSPTPATFNISLAGVIYTLTVQWNEPAQSWMLDIGDSSGVPIVNAIALVTGADLLGDYGYMNFGGQLIVQSDFDVDKVPDFNSLGTTGHLYFVVP